MQGDKFVFKDIFTYCSNTMVHVHISALTKIEWNLSLSLM